MVMTQVEQLRDELVATAMSGQDIEMMYKRFVGSTAGKKAIREQYPDAERYVKGLVNAMRKAAIERDKPAFLAAKRLLARFSSNIIAKMKVPTYK